MLHHLLIPLISTLAGFLCGGLARLLLLQRLPFLIRTWAQDILPTLVDRQDIVRLLAGKNNFTSIGPVVEGHIDEFLTHKLGKEMPMIGMFIGDKTIAQLKSIFMKELEEIFPLIMDKYLEDISGNLHLEMLMAEKFDGLSFNTSQSMIAQMAGPKLALLPVYGAIAGLITGLAQLAALSLLP